MAAASGQLRAAVAQPARSAFAFEPVKVVRRLKPAPLTECWDCGGVMTSGHGHGVSMLHLLESLAQPVDPVPVVGAPDHDRASPTLPVAVLSRRTRVASSRSP